MCLGGYRLLDKTIYIAVWWKKGDVKVPITKMVQDIRKKVNYRGVQLRRFSTNRILTHMNKYIIKINVII